MDLKSGAGRGNIMGMGASSNSPKTIHTKSCKRDYAGRWHCL